MFLYKSFFIFLTSSLYTLLLCIFFKPIFYSNSIIFNYSLVPFDICQKYPIYWYYIKLCYPLISFLSGIIIFNSIYENIIKNFFKSKKTIKTIPKNGLNLYIGKTQNSEKIYLPEKGLFQNILITGTIGVGKTSSAMYPFTKQLIEYKNDKIGMLILDVKGNYYKQVKEYCIKYKRIDDLIIIGLDNDVFYNPLDKPHLSSQVLANRLKTILTLFSKNNTESYWLDKSEEVLSEAIKLCRLYNNNYVTFEELHKIIFISNYLDKKISKLRKIFQSAKLSQNDIYNLNTSINFFKLEFLSLDSRVLSILKSEIGRIINTFISNYSILKTFCPQKEKINFTGFKDVIKNR